MIIGRYIYFHDHGRVVEIRQEKLNMSVKEQKEQEVIWLQQGDPYEGFDENEYGDDCTEYL